MDSPDLVEAVVAHALAELLPEGTTRTTLDARTLAVHEAGHAALAHALGFSVRSVRVEPDPDHRGSYKGIVEYDLNRDQVKEASGELERKREEARQRADRARAAKLEKRRGDDGKAKPVTSRASPEAPPVKKPDRHAVAKEIAVETGVSRATVERVMPSEEEVLVHLAGLAAVELLLADGQRMTPDAAGAADDARRALHAVAVVVLAYAALAGIAVGLGDAEDLADLVLEELERLRARARELLSEPIARAAVERVAARLEDRRRRAGDELEAPGLEVQRERSRATAPARGR